MNYHEQLLNLAGSMESMAEALDDKFPDLGVGSPLRRTASILRDYTKLLPEGQHIYKVGKVDGIDNRSERRIGYFFIEDNALDKAQEYGNDMGGKPCGRVYRIGLGEGGDIECIWPEHMASI